MAAPPTVATHDPAGVADRCIRQIWDQSRQTYGWRRVRAELADAYGQVVNKKLVQSIMRELGISGLRKRRKGRPNLKNRATSVDLVHRDFDRDGPNQLSMTDIAEHPTREGTVYCCAVLDAWSRKVVGWSIDRRPTAAMVNAALGMAIENRRPPAGTLVHSDHGSQGELNRSPQHLDCGGVDGKASRVDEGVDGAVADEVAWRAFVAA